VNPTPSTSPSKLIRRVHLYLALFLTPWMIVYALSGLVLNHNETVRSWYGGKFPEFEKIEERPYTTVFSTGATPREIGVQVLADLGLAGSFNTPPNPPAERLVFNRFASFSAHRVTYFRTENRVVIEKQITPAPVIVNRAHFRSGYEQPYLASKIWAATVDLAVVGMIFWILSGVFMWWEIKPARLWGALCAFAGFGIFGVLLATL